MTVLDESVKAFGVREYTRASSPADEALEDLRLVGYTVLPAVLSAGELAYARAAMDEIHQRQLAEVGGRENLDLIGDGHTAMCLLAYDDFFIRLAAHPDVLRIVEAYLGENYVLMLQNGILNMPQIGHVQTPGCWHRDLGYQHMVTSRPLGVTALYCIDAFSLENGGTHVLGATHKAEAFPSETFVRRHHRGVVAEAGSVIVLDAMLYHRAGLNRSSSVRRAVNNIYTLPLIKQQIDLPKFLNGRFNDDPLLRKVLGYDSELDDSVVGFRQRRIRRAQRGGVMPRVSDSSPA